MGYYDEDKIGKTLYIEYNYTINIDKIISDTINLEIRGLKP